MKLGCPALSPREGKGEIHLLMCQWRGLGWRLETGRGQGSTRTIRTSSADRDKVQGG